MCPFSERLSNAEIFTIGDIQRIFKLAERDLLQMVDSTIADEFISPVHVMNSVSHHIGEMIKSHADDMIVGNA